MDKYTILQAFAVVVFVVGAVAFALGGTGVESVGLTADEAFAAGVIFTSVGFVMFADLRRRAKREHDAA